MVGPKQDRLTLRQLQYFVTVAEALSFRRAAERLGVSQPTLTGQIAALEAALGLVLFERSRSGTTLSPAGRELLGSAQAVLEQARGLTDRARSLAGGPSGTFRLGVPPTLGPYLLPHILPDLHRAYAGVQLYVREGVPRQLLEDLRSGRYDLILTPLPIPEGQLTVAPLFREPIRLVLGPEHPLTRREVVRPRDLRGVDVLLIDETHLFHRQVEQLCDRLGANVRRDYEGTSLDTLRHMVLMGMGAAFLPALYVRSEIRPSDELQVTRIAGEAVERVNALVWRDTSPTRSLFREMAEHIRATVADKLLDEVVPVAA